MEALECFSEILIESYIRTVVSAENVKRKQENETAEPVAVSFKISKEYYERVKNCVYQAPLLGLSLSYDETSEILTATPEDFLLKQLENKIIQDVVLKEAETNQNRYSNFISCIK